MTEAYPPKVIRPVYFYYTDHMESYLSVTKHLPHAEHVDTSASSYAYWDEIVKRWVGLYDLLFIEQHIVIHEDVLPQLQACPNDWCTFAVGNQLHGLGCTRFSAALQQRMPIGEVKKRARRKCPHCGAPHFTHVDGPMLDALRDVGGYLELNPCVHRPEVRHLPE